ncbi:P12 [Rachiplusia nu nucleopolyhedrovirus]|uniref:P12 n=1 Tax=Rachiplusia nu nucleopolyhedrovirus TaxID=2605775 RepID=A0AAE6M6E0_9ABAC|nr:P12 [Rachiplusia nu nucleopolyhedrovirus]QEI03683.1 P12 [Rachiplusia nu nucleopolyhedrovirus]
MNSAELLLNLNQTATVSDLILNDTNPLKRNAINVLSRQSATAKNLLTAVDNNDSSLRLDTIRSINVLQLLSDVYDNKFVIVNQ